MKGRLSGPPLLLLLSCAASAPSRTPPTAQPRYEAAGESFRARPPEPSPDADFVAPPIHEFELSNGIRVHSAYREGPLCAIRVLMPSDDAARGDLATTALLSFELLDGTKQHDGFSLRREAGEVGAHLDSWWSPEWITATVTVRPPMSRGVALLAEMLTSSTFPQVEFEAQRAYLSSLAEEAATRRADVATRALRETLFGATHPYGKVTATPAELRAVRREDLLAAYARLVDPSRMIVTAGGACDEQELRASLQRELGAIQRSAKSTAPLPPPSPVHGARKLVIVDAAGDPQADVTVAALVAVLPASDWYTGLVAAQVMRERAARRIVQEAALSDDVHVSLSGYRQGAWIAARATVRLDKAASMLGELEALFSRLQEASAEEVGASRSRTLLQDAGSYERATDIASGAATLAFDGVGLDGFTKIRSEVGRTDAAAVHAYAARYLSPSHLVGVVVGDRSALSTAIRRLPWPSIEVRDRAGALLQP